MPFLPFDYLKSELISWFLPQDSEGTETAYHTLKIPRIRVSVENCFNWNTSVLVFKKIRNKC